MAFHVGDHCRILPQPDRVLLVNDKRYLIKYSATDETCQDYSGPTLITVFASGDKPVIAEQWMKQQMDKYQADDVFDTAFLQGVVLLGCSEIDTDARDLLKRGGMRWIHNIGSRTNETKLPPGPYILLDGHFRKVYRAYADYNGAFFCPVELSGESFRTPDMLPSIEGNTLTIAVPSRIRFQPTTEQPMAGLRVAVKDNFDIEGIKTSLTSRPFYDTFPVKQNTAKCIQRLVDLGATIVGKTKLTSFGTWEEPNESIDFPAPWNPRADGFLSAGGSSNGSGAAVSSYEWLDIAIGSDTTGSILRPALWNGCFAIRPSHGLLSTDGFHSSIKYLDTPAFLGRDLKLCRDFAAAWYGFQISVAASQRPFSKVLWPTDYWNDIDTNQRQLALSFLNDLESLLGLKHERLSFKAKWHHDPPPEAADQSLDAYMLKATEDMWFDDYHSFDDFRAKYYCKYTKRPYASPPTQNAWEHSKHITRDERDEAVTRLDVFRTWFSKVILEVEHQHALLILPIENVYARYRDETHTFQRPPLGVHNLLLAPLLKAPELVVPLGYVSYHSKITQTEQQLPFAIGLMSPPGSDLTLFDTTLACLRKSGRPVSVQTGSTMFPAPTSQGLL